MQDPRDRQTPQAEPAARSQPVFRQEPALEGTSGGGSAGGGPKRPARPARRYLWGGLAAAALLAAIGFGLIHHGGPQSDDPTPQQIAEMNASWSAATASGLQLDPVASGDVREAIGNMHLAPDIAEELLRDVTSGKTSLVWVTLWDDMSEDGDVVALSSEGIRTVVTLKNAQTRIALPRPSAGVIDMEGVTDGAGGGITVGIMSGSTPVEVSPMQPGQVIGIPVR
jgi:hypothetical protein